MFYIVYKVTNTLNDKIYIGKHQTENLNDSYMGSGKLIKDAIKKHGIENFTKEILFQFDNEADMNAKEAELVTEDFAQQNTNYNLCPGGQGGWGFINNELGDARNPFRSPENQKKWSNKRNIPNIIQKLKERKTGLFDKNIQKLGSLAARSETSREKKKETYSMINHQKGNKNSQFGTIWIHSIDLKQNKKIKKGDVIPDGWNVGRKIKFPSP